MTEEATFVDSSAFLAFFVEGMDVFEKISGLLVTSTNVIEEVTYVLIKERAKDVTGIRALRPADLFEGKSRNC